MAKFARWVQIPVLLDPSEMTELFDALGEFLIVNVSSVSTEGEISRQAFLNIYAEAIASLRAGQVPASPWFSSCLTTTWEAIEVRELPDGRAIRRAAAPVIQLQPHTFTHSDDDGKFRSMVRGAGAIWWGLQFSYPGLYEDPKTREIVKVDASFPNSPIFRTLQRWVRHHTRPTPFLVDGELVNVPIRTGKRVFEWIDEHPQLGERLCVLKS